MRIYADTSRRTGALDGLGRELHVGLGCAIENLAIATRARGLAPTVTLLPDGTDSTLVAHIALGASTPGPTVRPTACASVRHDQRRSVLAGRRRPTPDATARRSAPRL